MVISSVSRPCSPKIISAGDFMQYETFHRKTMADAICNNSIYSVEELERQCVLIEPLRELRS